MIHGMDGISTWNPNDPCFDWKRPCFGGVEVPTNFRQKCTGRPMDPSWPLDPGLVFSVGRSIQDFSFWTLAESFFASKKTEPAGGCPAGSDVS